MDEFKIGSLNFATCGWKMLQMFSQIFSSKTTPRSFSKIQKVKLNMDDTDETAFYCFLFLSLNCFTPDFAYYITYLHYSTACQLTLQGEHIDFDL